MNWISGSSRGFLASTWIWMWHDLEIAIWRVVSMRLCDFGISKIQHRSSNWLISSQNMTKLSTSSTNCWYTSKSDEFFQFKKKEKRKDSLNINYVLFRFVERLFCSKTTNNKNIINLVLIHFCHLYAHFTLFFLYFLWNELVPY